MNRTLSGNLTATIGKNTVYGIISNLFQVATRLVTVPVVIYHLGLGGYGIWSIIMTAAIYMRIGSVGVKGAFQKYVAEATGDGAYKRASQLLSTGTAVITVLSLVGLIPVCIFSKHVAAAAGVPPEFLMDSARAFSVLALTMVLSNSGAAYEAIVLGSHRIDLARKASSLLAVAEAVAILGLLHVGLGLFAMACVMAASELFFLVYCYAVAHRVLPEVQVAPRFVTGAVWRELVRFAGSYQLLNLLQLTYSAIVPVAVLRAYGADQAGVYAVANRLAQPVMMCQNAFLLPILSGGAMVFASGQSERLRTLLSKSFKVNLALTLAPFALISIFGSYMVEAWTGQTDPLFRSAIWLTCLALFFQAFCQLGLVLYRSAGGALMDNIREVVRLAAFVPVLFMTHRVGFLGMLGWMVVAEFVGMLLMFFALDRTFHMFDMKLLLPDAVRFTAATTAIVGFVWLAVYAVPAIDFVSRAQAAVKVAVVCLATLIVAYPALNLSGAISGSELQSIVDALRKGRSAGTPSLD